MSLEAYFMNIEQKAKLYADAQFMGNLRIEKDLLIPVIPSLENTLKILKGINQEHIQINPELVELIETELKEAKLSVAITTLLVETEMYDEGEEEAIPGLFSKLKTNFKTFFEKKEK
jgi:hypothetical protein